MRSSRLVMMTLFFTFSSSGSKGKQSFFSTWSFTFLENILSAWSSLSRRRANPSGAVNTFVMCISFPHRISSSWIFLSLSSCPLHFIFTLVIFPHVPTEPKLTTQKQQNPTNSDPTSSLSHLTSKGQSHCPVRDFFLSYTVAASGLASANMGGLVVSWAVCSANVGGPKVYSYSV